MRVRAFLCLCLVPIALVGAAHLEPAAAGQQMRIHMMRTGTSGPKTPQNASTNPMSYHGGNIQTAVSVYVVFWNWTSDPQGVAGYLQNFLNGVGGSAWNSTLQEYCQGVGGGSTNCSNGTATFSGNPSGILAGVWSDPSAAPSSPTPNDLANEALNAAAHFGNTSWQSNANAQYVIATATGRSSSGFGTQYCAWHSDVFSSYGDVYFTNLPYMPDAGASCGANYLGGVNDGVSIVEGHELAETENDPALNAWYDGSTSGEIGDKCAWTSISHVGLTTGSFPMQPLWSNHQAGCVFFGTGSSPLGSFDVASSPAAGRLRVAGWAYDPDATQTPLQIHVYVGGPAGSGAHGYGLCCTSVYRPDVQNVHPDAGAYTGFDFTFDVSPTGFQNVYVYAINVGLGGNVSLGSKYLQILNPTPPGPPNNLQAVPGPAASSITLSWSPPSDDGGSPVTGYDIYRSDKVHGTVHVASVGPTGSFTDTNLTPMIGYHYTVYADNGIGQGPASNSACTQPSPWIQSLGCPSG